MMDKSMRVSLRELLRPKVADWRMVERSFKRHRDKRIPISLPTKETFQCLRSEWVPSEELVECES